MKSLSIMGSTGSIGTNALKIVEMFPDRFCVKVLAAKNNISLLAGQIQKFSPDFAVVFDEKSAEELKRITANSCVEILYGDDGYNAAASYEPVDMVIAAMVGSAGLMPTLSAIAAGKNIALANKETLVMAGKIVMEKAAEKNVKILPIDSEHSAIFQCIAGHRREDMDKILLTASGGPFLNLPMDEFNNIKPEDTMNHPTWEMGRKISVDSATLMNKGLEVMEAGHLFGVSPEDIEVIIHPQSVIHSMVSYKDGSVIAQMSIPDMKGAIAYAMSYPERLPLGQPLPDFKSIGSLTFQKPDTGKFPCLDLAFSAGKTGGTLPSVLNAANEVAVEAFLNKRLHFTDIPKVIRKTMEKHFVVANPALSDILDADFWARKIAVEQIP
ncbi:MAG: 1-deoxy-D-xylulose-5-phosphate reductoisomerase [Pseudomonadota bacterium]|nr:1-deoxy-D-xylulose-5-phosphate reductoisomerase [Pseudomonadota bacterium]MBU1397749.1 1-deoxy-D-xylulose-5-phosphate reductoisomerase [Pseudomonadota bacterium]MBU1569280.1 1-deoxy-D-xylulose-5-phosphate reductoisomerase [Pseudomonadota bacterium]